MVEEHLCEEAEVLTVDLKHGNVSNSDKMKENEPKPTLFFLPSTSKTEIWPSR